MIVKYNSLDKTEAPILTLCNPGSTYTNGFLTNVVGILTDCEAEEIVFNFNSPSELNFRINKVERDTSEENTSIIKLYDAVKNRRLIFIDGIGYFSITTIEDNYQGGIVYKDVKAQSIEVELQQKQIPYIEDGTYRFLTDGNETTIGLFNRIVELLPLWTIGHIDETIKEKWRTFEDVDVTLNCLGFLIDSMQEAYECIFLFDIINRRINVYEQSNYIHRTGIQITKGDIIKSLNISENADDLYTAISVQGSDELNISAINPLGGSVIYNFHYYLSWMSSGLRDKVTQWQTAVNNAKSDYYQINLNYFNKLQEVSNLRAEINQLDCQITMYTRCKDSIIANADTSFVDDYNTDIIQYGGEEIVVYADVADTVSALAQQIGGCQAEKAQTQTSLTTAQRQLNSYLTQIQTINNQLSITNYFSQTEYAELANYIFEGSYTDDFIKVTDIMSYSEKFQQMKILYDRAEAQLLKVSEPTQEFDVDSESVIFDSNFSHWNDQIETGCLISVELVKNDWAWLFLSTITVNYDDKNLKFTFGNRFNKYDAKSLFDKTLGSISKSANTLQYIKDVLFPLKDGTFDDMKDAIQSSRNITMASALISNNEEVVIDGSGYTGKSRLPNGQYSPQQVKITGKNIVFTDDAWDTAKTALGEILLSNNTRTYGINAETLVGELIVGERLILQNPEQSLTFNEDGITVYNNTNSFILNPSGNTLISIKKGNQEIFGLDSNGGLHIEADGSGIDLTSNNSILGLYSNIQLSAKEIKETVSSAVSKYSTGSYNVSLYGYGTPNSYYDADDYNNQYYLNQSNGYLYKSNGASWSLVAQLSLITTDLQSEIVQTEKDIKSTIGEAMSKYDIGNRNIDIYGYGTPASAYDASSYNNKYYLNQTNGYLYKSNGSGWVYQETLTLISSAIQSQITQTANTITTTVANTYETKSDATTKLNTATGYTDTEIASAKSYAENYADSGISTARNALESQITQTADSIKSTIASSQSKYDASGYSISIYGYGDPNSTMYPPDDHNNELYLNQSNGRLWLSTGGAWTSLRYLSLITDGLRSQITQSADAIKSTIASSQSKYDTTGYNVSIFDYGAPSTTNYPPNSHNGEYYLDQTNGKLYYCNGSTWALRTILTLITTKLSTQISQTTDDITAIVTRNGSGTIVSLDSSKVNVAWNGIDDAIQLDTPSNIPSLTFYTNSTSTKKLLLRLNKNGLKFYNPSVSTSKPLIHFKTDGMNVYESNSTNLSFKVNSNGCFYYYNNVYVGKIGTNGWYGNNNFRGLITTLNNTSSYIAWAYVETVTLDGGGTEDRPIAKLIYYPSVDVNGNNRKGFTFAENVYFNQNSYYYGNIDMQGHAINNAVINSSSDIRMKTNIEDVKISALDIINQIELKSFDWIENNSHENIGIIAQQLNEVLPDAVYEDKETTKLSIQPLKLIPYIIKAIQELSFVDKRDSHNNKASNDSKEYWNVPMKEKQDFVRNNKMYCEPMKDIYIIETRENNEQNN